MNLVEITLLIAAVSGRALLVTAGEAFYSLTGTKADGSIVSMEDFRGKVVYATNVASMWGYTQREYARFAALGQQYTTEELVILAFPSREYGQQEFETNEEIADFCTSQRFPDNGILMALGSVKGARAPAIWKHLREETGNRDPAWNFDSKYLVSKTGEVIVTSDVEGDIDRLNQESDEL